MERLFAQSPPLRRRKRRKQPTFLGPPFPVAAQRKKIGFGAPRKRWFSLWIIPRRNGADVGFSGESCINIRIREKSYISNRLSSQISIERRKNKKNIQEKEKNNSRWSAFLHKVPRCAAPLKGGGIMFEHMPPPQPIHIYSHGTHQPG